MNYDDKCQLLIIGNSTVGKTSILSKYASKTFNENYLATVGLDFFTKDDTIDNKIIRIKIWDTAGQERYKALTKCFFQKAQGVMVVFDVTNQKSFDDLKFWLDSIKTHIYDDDYVPIVIIGNKIDLQKRVVQKKDANEFAEQHHYHYYETSAKTGDGIDMAIRELVKNVMNNGGKKNGRENLRISLNKKKSGKCC